MTTQSTRTYTYQDSKKCHTIRNTEPPRSTAYYYADLERLKRDQSEPRKTDQSELSEYVEANDVINDGPIREVPPLRDRNSDRKGETYSTAGTFPMPKEKEPLLAELEVVGRLPLTQLDGTGVRRSRSWFCCPDVEEEISRESSWRYSSLRPVTAPPAPGRNGMTAVLVSQPGVEDASSLRAERDALARALSASRRAAAEAARAHDARLAELHGVIAELVRRRAADKHARAIPEEELEECSPSTLPCSEGSERSRGEHPGSAGDPPSHQIRVEVSPSPAPCDCDTSLHLSERDSDTCLAAGRCCAEALSGGSCERERGSSDGPRPHTASPGRSESRQAKLASRVVLRRAADRHAPRAESWEPEQLALDVCAHADLREALLAASNDGAALAARAGAWRARCARLQADVCVLQCALAAAGDRQHRLYCACAVQEQRCVAVCAALRAADRALEAYDVLLALAETAAGAHTDERSAAELVARQLLATLDAEQGPPTSIGGPLLSPGPWLQHDHQTAVEEWSASSEARLRAHAASLKTETARLRPSAAAAPRLFSLHDFSDGEGEGEEEGEGARGEEAKARAMLLQDMEEAVALQEAMEAREAAATRALHAHAHAHAPHAHEHEQTSGAGRSKHWLEEASETDL